MKYLEVIRKAIEKHSLTQSQIAEKCKIDKGNLSRFLRSGKYISVESFLELLSFLKLTIRQE